MKRVVLLTIFGLSSLFANSCDYILKEGDKYLKRIPLCEVTAEKHSNIALAYYKRYELCKTELNNPSFRGSDIELNLYQEEVILNNCKDK